MDGFCWQGELDLTLFYKIEGCWGIFLNPEILNDLNDRDLNDRILGRNKNDRSPRIEVSGRFSFLSHAARYSERSSDSGQYADGYL